MKNIPNGLKELGFNRNMNYMDNATIDNIKHEIQNNAVSIVGVRTANNDGMHALVVDNIKNGRVYIRDPWPPGSGAAYTVPIKDFHDAFTGKVIFIK